MIDIKNTVFARLQPQERADRTTQVARQLAGEDQLARARKTEKLRALRLARDAEAAAAPPATKKPKKAK